MADFKIIDVPSLLAVSVTTRDLNGEPVPDDGEWHRQATSSQFVFAEFLVANGLVGGVSKIDRGPELTIWWSQLTAMGKAFVKAHYDRWLVSLDGRGLGEAAKLQRLQRRWRSSGGLQSN